MTRLWPGIAMIAVLQAGVILGRAAYHEHVWTDAPTFRIPLRPSDPYDVIRGRYFVLNPQDAHPATDDVKSPLSPDAVARFMGGDRYFSGPVLVTFCPVERLDRVCDLRRAGLVPEDGRRWARARASVQRQDAPGSRQGSSPGWHVSLDLGLDRFFLPDALTLPAAETTPGWSLEVSYRAGQVLLPRRLWFGDEPVGLGGTRD